MKKYGICLVLICHVVTSANDYTQDAQEWAQRYICRTDGSLKIEPEQLQFIANLLYFSYLRSQATVAIQPLGMRVMNGLWYGWHNIISTRLNPGQEIPHMLCSKQEQEAEQEFWHAYRHHRATAQTYVHTVNTVLKTGVLSDPVAELAVQNVRYQAQKIIAYALTNVKQHVNNLLHSQRSKKELFRGPLTQFIVSYIPQLAKQSFIEANTLSITTSKETWDIFTTIQDISNYTWHITEQARADFYRAFYQQLYQTMIEHEVDIQYMTILFNETGFIASDEQYTPLPAL